MRDVHQPKSVSKDIVKSKRPKSPKPQNNERAASFLELSDEEKLRACQVVRSISTMNGVSKDTLKVMFDWLFDASVIVEHEEEANCTKK